MDGHPMVIPPVFLSASEPDPDRKEEYWQSQNLLNVREAARAFCAHALAHYPVVYCGHPAITPLVRQWHRELNMRPRPGQSQENQSRSR